MALLVNFPYIPAEPSAAVAEPVNVIVPVDLFVAFESKAYIPADFSCDTFIVLVLVISESLLPYIPAEFSFLTFISLSFTPSALSV